MHSEVKAWGKWVLARFPQFQQTKVSILDFGSQDINGNNRRFFPNILSYTGIDLTAGRNVDVVCLAHEYKHHEKVDVVICTEMLEHDKYAKESFINMVSNLRSGGMLMMTCAGYGRPEHGTRASKPEDSPHTLDFYENVTLAIFAQWLDFDLVFSHYEVNKEKDDFRFFGIKR